ncbi:porin [Vibrio breoganii]
MKKTLLALAVASVAATSVNAAEIYKSDDGSVDFYGQLRQELNFLDSNDSDQAHTAELGNGSSRTGINAKYSITDSVDALGLVEISVGEGELSNRLHYVGVATDFGTVTFGRQYIATDDVWGADYSYYFGGSALRGETLNGGKHSSAIKYAFDNESFWVKGTWGLDENDSEQELYDAFVGTGFGDLEVHAGVGYTRDRNFTLDTGGTRDLSNTYAEFTGEYFFEGGHQVGFTYYWAEVADEEGTNNKINENGISLAGWFQAFEKTAFYGGYELTLQDLKDTDLDDDGTVIYLGVEHRFNSWARVYAEYAYLDGRTLGYQSGGDVNVNPGATNDAFNSVSIGARVYW